MLNGIVVTAQTRTCKACQAMATTIKQPYADYGTRAKAHAQKLNSVKANIEAEAQNRRAQASRGS